MSSATSIPTFLDQLFSYTTAADLMELIFESELAGYLGGMPQLDRDEVIALVRSVPLEPAIRLSVWVQRRLRLDPTNAAKQLETMELLYGPVFRAAGELLLREQPRRALFSEQQAFALQRLLLLHAEDRPAEDLTEEEQARLLWACLWIPDAILDPDLTADATLPGWELADERFLRFFVASGGLAGRTAFKHELARAHVLYHVVANSTAARRHRDYCPLDGWLEERYGLDFVGLQTFGFSFFARSNVGDREGGALLYANKDYFAPTALVAEYDKAIEAIAAPREWFEAEFSQSKEKARRAAWEIQPFLRRPALLQRDGNAVVLGLRALEGWLSSTGAYYRLFDLARARGEADMERFRRFNGWLQERYVRQLTHIAHPYAHRRVLAGSGRVLGQQPYKVKRRGESMTSDVAVDLGLDLVLVEVTTKRVTQRSLVDGDIEGGDRRRARDGDQEDEAARARRRRPRRRARPAAGRRLRVRRARLAARRRPGRPLPHADALGLARPAERRLPDAPRGREAAHRAARLARRRRVRGADGTRRCRQVAHIAPRAEDVTALARAGFQVDAPRALRPGGRAAAVHRPGAAAQLPRHAQPTAPAAARAAAATDRPRCLMPERSLLNLVDGDDVAACVRSTRAASTSRPSASDHSRQRSRSGSSRPGWRTSVSPPTCRKTLQLARSAPSPQELTGTGPRPLSKTSQVLALTLKAHASSNCARCLPRETVSWDRGEARMTWPLRTIPIYLAASGARAHSARGDDRRRRALPGRGRSAASQPYARAGQGGRARRVARSTTSRSARVGCLGRFALLPDGPRPQVKAETATIPGV
jgi:hypothetical protein